MLWITACVAIAFLVILLADLTCLRIKFPWDNYFWPESPFLTNILKLDNHSPIYTSPADGNSFVYAPGLEYICYAILKPPGLELDIRYCRVINVALGLLACFFAARAMGHISKPKNLPAPPWLRFLAAFGLTWLVLSKNPMADVMHPDNLQAFHAVSVFYFCLTALETRRFGLALLTMVWAGLGVFSKQTGAVGFLGPALIFAWYNPWGRRRSLFLAAIGAAVVAASTYVLWLPQYARFFTFQLMSHQGVSILKLHRLAIDMLAKDRGLLLFLAIIAALWLWSDNERDAGNVKNRRYLICWTVIGFFAAGPNLAAYLKTMGWVNNLVLFEIWFIMIAWPVFIQVLDRLALPAPVEFTYSKFKVPMAFPTVQCAAVIVLLLLLTPAKRIPQPAEYEYSRKVENAVRNDFKGGRKVLVSHGTEYLIRAGITNVPFDRCNSVLELKAGGMASLANMKSRLHEHYYDRIYLVHTEWYSPDIVDVLNKEYVQETVIVGPTAFPNEAQGFGWGFMGDCTVMVPRPDSSKL